jgi:alpha-L-rhamnosidase
MCDRYSGAATPPPPPPPLPLLLSWFQRLRLYCVWPDHGFRYAQIQGLPEDGLLVWQLEARVVHSDVESSASLTFGGPTSASLNQLQSNLEWTQRDNLHSVPTDCNQRTERQGWMADASVSAETAHHNFAMKPFYRNWLRSIVDVQQDFPAADPNDHR